MPVVQKNTKIQSGKKPGLTLVERMQVIGLSVLVGSIIIGLGVFLYVTQRTNQIISYQSAQGDDVPTEVSLQFPVSVNPKEEVIHENPIAEDYFEVHLFSQNLETPKRQSGLFMRVLGKLALMDWYQNLASASSRVLVIQPGERKEQVVQHFGKILGWNTQEKKNFVTLIEQADPVLIEGKFYPGTYTVPRDAKPADVAPLILERFNEEVFKRYGSEVSSLVPLSDALTIASLLEREAYDFNDMREISGVIWNRLFVDMRLQIDATLQYAKGTTAKDTWWPKVLPKDKYIVSEYNTYKNEGLPPTPIANPSLAAILAALNPKKTDCMYYFHDKKAQFHCTRTYEEHVALLKQYYGRGK